MTRDLRDDSGLGIITVILVMAVMSALVITATALTVNNVGNVRRDRQALSAIATSEAGVAQAIQHLRGSNLASLVCKELPNQPLSSECSLPGPSWTSKSSPQIVRVDGSAGTCDGTVDCFKVWIGTVQPYVPNCPARHATPPGKCYGTYRIHSTGVSGNGPGARRVAVDVQAGPDSFPLGVFSEQGFSGNGNVGIHSESIFTAGCLVNRQNDAASGSGTQFQYDSVAGRAVIDLFYDQPAAAHAVGGVSTNNNTCTGDGHIHVSSPCNSTFKFDQDGEGAALTPGDACYGKYTRSDGTVYPTTSSFKAADLQALGYRPRGLTDAQYDDLKAQAKAQGTYNLATGSVNAALTGLVTTGTTSPVLFWDNASVSLNSTDLPASFLRDVSTSPTCAQNTLTIVVIGPGHDLSYTGGNSGPLLVASIFVPDGTLTGQGGRNTIGTVFAKVVDLGGNVDFNLDQCFVNSPPGAALDVQVLTFREDDSTDIN